MKILLRCIRPKRDPDEGQSEKGVKFGKLYIATKSWDEEQDGDRWKCYILETREGIWYGSCFEEIGKITKE